MKKKNGFIATSVILSFFLTFILLITLLLATYSEYRYLRKFTNGNILKNLNDNIKDKYITFENIIKNGNFEEGCNSNWFSDEYLCDYIGKYENRHYSGEYSFSLKSNSEEDASITISYDMDNLVVGDTYLILYRLFRNGFISDNSHIGVGEEILNVDFERVLNSSDNINNFNKKDKIFDGGAINWTSYAANFTPSTSDVQLDFVIKINKSDIDASLYIDDIMVINISDYCNLSNSTCNINGLASYFAKRPYFDKMVVSKQKLKNIL